MGLVLDLHLLFVPQSKYRSGVVPGVFASLGNKPLFLSGRDEIDTCAVIESQGHFRYCCE